MEPHPDYDNLWDKIHLSRIHQRILKAYEQITDEKYARATFQWTYTNSGYGRYEQDTIFLRHTEDLNQMVGSVMQYTVSHILYMQNVQPRRNLPIYQRTLSIVIEIMDNFEIPYTIKFNPDTETDYDHMMGDKDYPICTLLGPNVYLKWDDSVSPSNPQILQKKYGVLALVHPSVKEWDIEQATKLFEE